MVAIIRFVQLGVLTRRTTAPKEFKFSTKLFGRI